MFINPFNEIKLLEYLSTPILADSTILLYNRMSTKYISFCKGDRLDPLELEGLIMFLVSLKDLNPTTVMNYYRAILWYAQEIAENERSYLLFINNPTVKKVLFQQRGLFRKRGGTKKLKRPLFSNDVLRICEELDSRGLYRYNRLANKLSILLLFGGVLRVSELLNLKFNDVYTSVSGRKMDVFIRIRSSKTSGSIYVKPCFPDHRIKKELFETLRAYEELRKVSDYEEFIFSFKGKTINSKTYQKKIKKLFGNQYSAGSLRTGAASELQAKKNVPAEIARLYLGHFSKSNSLQYYTSFLERCPPELLEAPREVKNP